jgi:VIT1/CCC1 family predicted Fe2+/Mn2+ transporter
MAREALQDTALSRAVTELFADLSDFVQKELRLARAELLHKLNVRLNAGIWLVAAGFLGIVAVLLIIEGIVFAIASAGLALHWSCLVVAAALVVVAVLMFFYGRSRMAAEDLAPTRTARQLSEAMTAAKEHLR